MAVMKVRGVPMSTATMRVIAAIFEKGQQLELVPVNMAAGEHKSEAFLALNPFGQIPVLEDGDVKLFESRAITQYLAHTYSSSGTQLVPQGDPKKMTIASVWMEVEAQQFDPVASKLTFELGIKPFLGLAVDPAAVADHKAKLAKVLDVYEARLAQSKYLGGDAFTLADLHHFPCLHYLLASEAKELFLSRPHVAAWCADILARPAWSKVVELQKKP